MLEYRAFTVLFDKITNELTSPTKIWSEFVTGKPVNTQPIEATALWDTGAIATCIKPWLKDKLNLRLLNTQTLLAGVGGEINAHVTLVNIQLMCDVEIYDCPVYVADFPGDEDILIGMDIINMGDFVVCDTDGKTSFSFAIPPLPERTNFVEMVKTTNVNKKNTAKNNK
jgi:predicted aspartyl protease